MTPLVDIGQVNERSSRFSNLRAAGFASHSQAFGPEPNALPKLCNCYAYSTIKAPDKGEVGGSSPPRPTIKSPINTRLFSLFPSWGLLRKSNLPKICQKFGVLYALSVIRG